MAHSQRFSEVSLRSSRDDNRDSNASELTLLNDHSSSPASVHSSRAPSPRPQGLEAPRPSTSKTPPVISTPLFPSKHNPEQAKPYFKRACGSIRRCYAIIDSWWILEIVAASLATTAMLSIVLILRMTNKTPLRQWHYSISPNTLISIFDTTAAVTIVFCAGAVIEQSKWIYFRQKARPLKKLELFNEGSRGPLGALFLTFGVHRGAVAACASAVVVALQLAMDPLAQSAINLAPGRTWITPNASFPVSQIYDPDIGQCSGTPSYCES
jgi:hypothetical protein